MSWFNRFTSGARRLASNIMDSVRRRVTDFGNWLTNYVRPDQTSQVLREVAEHVRENYPPQQPFEVRESASAVNNFARVHTINGKEGIDVRPFFQSVRGTITRILRNNRRTKVKIILICNMEKLSTLGEIIIAPSNFSSEIEVNLDGTDEDDLFVRMTERGMENMASQQQVEGSGWRFHSIIRLELHVVSYNPLRGEAWVALAKELANKNAIINPKNEDNKCFLWCVLRALNPTKDHPERIDKKLKEKENTLNMEGIEYPVSLKDIDKFEKQNTSIFITVFGYEDKSVYLLRNSENTNREHNVILLLIKEEEVNHYCLVKNLSRLLSSQVSKHDGKKYFCMRCLNPFNNQKALDKHEEYCSYHEAVKIIMPKKGTMLRFENYHRGEKVPFVIYADFESCIKSIDTCDPNPENSYTKQYQKHEPISFYYYIKSFDSEVSLPIKERSYTGKNADRVFLKYLEEDIKMIANIKKKEIIFVEKEKERYNEETRCWICKGEFGENEEKVKDHCHYTGRYRGAAHNECNLKYRNSNVTPVVFHNLSGYDSHLFIKNLGFSEGNIDCIPNNEEKYISFSKKIKVGTYSKMALDADGDIFCKQKPKYHTIRFIDSLKFMTTSLEKLVNNLPKDDCINLSSYYSGDKFNLLARKGVYPYEYMDSLEKLKETALPPKEAFYSRLNDGGISDEDYAHAQNVWKTFKMKYFKDYHELYNKVDVLLLADVFENFRNICLTNYGLDPAHYYTAPGLAWDAALKVTGVSLELLSDVDMLLMIEEGIRGGVSMISNRYAKANNKYMNDKFNSNEPSTYIQYLDANNLYGWAMSKPLPTHGFKWMKDSELNIWEKTPCILEVDLEYPKELHDLHNDYPLAPEQIKVNKTKKLTPNLWDKKNYVIHYENLKQCLNLGLKITNIHRGLKFKESRWLKKYIDINTDLRTKAINEFEKEQFKLMNNSVFGKTMENIRNRVDIKLVNDKNKAERLAAKPNFKHCNIFSKDLTAIHMKKTFLTFNKPVYLGMCILDLSKTLMFDFHYNYVKKKYGDKAKLLFTDTDSLMYEIRTEDFYEDIKGDVKDRFDTSNYPSNHPSGIPTECNKKVPGMFKDEAGGKIIDEFVGLRAKLYSYKMFEGEESKKCKGVKSLVVKNSITHDDYKNCLFTGTEQLRKMNVIRSHKHDIYTEEVNKVALSSNDDKRHLLEGQTTTLPLGNYRI